jgi:hypothetical protein
LKNEIERVKRVSKEDMDGQRREYELKLKKQLKQIKTVEKENICENHEEKQRLEQMIKEIDRLNLKIRSMEHEKKITDAEVVRLTHLN